jgi:hypothetical protein
MTDVLVAGGNGDNGRVTTRGKDNEPVAELIAGDKEAIVAAGQKGGRSGRLTLYDGNGNAAVNLTSLDGHAVIGGPINGRITAAGKDGQPVAELIAGDKEAVIAAGQLGRPARVSLYNGSQAETIRLDAGAGDVLLFNADCAEEFDVENSETVEPGTVLVLADGTTLQPNEQAYDTRVVGVVSGAGDWRPAIVLDRRPSNPNRLPVALVGKVFCKVDADPTPIHVGDLLTTSDLRGHAMRALDPSRAFGSVLGKALGALETGRGLIPVLVALQ